MQSTRMVYFDVGGTLLTAHPSVGHVYAEAIGALGYRVEPRQIQARFRAACAASHERRARHGYTCDDETLRREWLQIVRDSFQGLAPEDAAVAVFDDLYARFSRGDAWRVADSAVELLAWLRGRGLRLGILSNWDSRLETTLGDLELLEYFPVRVVSHAVGVEKPHERIFAEAIERSAVAPSEILFIGDSLEADILPATRLGLRTVWIDDEEPEDTPIPEGATRVASLRHLLEILGETETTNGD